MLTSFQVRGSTAIFMPQTPTEDEINNLFGDWIKLTSSNTWNPEGMSFCRTPGLNLMELTHK